jgi:lipopolysaccharide/colanic/teichoic acid biosynthesis glycosyltransferase
MAVKFEDRGPAIFRQSRIGRDGVPFDVLKLTTMAVVVDAEARLAALQAETNERSGPLFKMERDPRFTRVGRFMDLTSINELPQLWNVIRGDMSIVGRRPALPAEFDSALKTRTVVRPGITGLWQVEARDNPSFEAYRRFDLHYVENWSVALDVVILVATAESVLARLLRMARGTPAAAATADVRNPPRLRVAAPLDGDRRGGPDRRGNAAQDQRPTGIRSAS